MEGLVEKTSLSLCDTRLISFPLPQHEHLVEKVSPVTNEEGGTSWAITARDLNGDSSSTTICDAVFICNG